MFDYECAGWCVQYPIVRYQLDMAVRRAPWLAHICRSGTKTLIITGLWLSASWGEAHDNDQSHSQHSHLRHVLRQVLIRVIKLLEEKSPHLSNSSASDLLGILIAMIMLWGSLYLHNTGPAFGCLSCFEMWWDFRLARSTVIEHWCQYQGWWAGVLLNITNDVPDDVIMITVITQVNCDDPCPPPLCTAHSQPSASPLSLLNMQHI